MLVRCSNNRGAAHCMGAFIERYVSAITSSRASASSTSACGPLAATQASFICGRAAIFDNPLRVKVNTS